MRKSFKIDFDAFNFFGPKQDHNVANNEKLVCSIFKYPIYSGQFVAAFKDIKI